MEIGNKPKWCFPKEHNWVLIDCYNANKFVCTKCHAEKENIPELHARYKDIKTGEYIKL